MTNNYLLPLLDDIADFSTSTGRELRDYQAECARAVARSVLFGEGKVFTIMFGRQMGKNETSAQIEAYLLALYAGRGGSIVKAAPSFKPQIVTSMLRLKDTLDSSPVTSGRWRPAFGYMLQLGRASIAFLSAQESANVVGATASLLLEIDEAQDVDPDKYDREFRPMASSTNATTVLYGTAWSADSILEQQKRLNIRHEQATGERLHFQFDWTALAAINPSYRVFVEGEMARLGRDHPSIRTQYLLECLADAGRLFSEEQREKLQGSHPRQSGPIENEQYIAGIDFAGRDEDAEDAAARALKPRRDSTVITIARLSRDAAGRPIAEVVEHIWWTGRDHVRQHAELLSLWDRWQFTRVCADASGIGYGIAHFLQAAKPDRLEPLIFTAPAKSQLAYTLLGMINTDRLRLYAADGSAEHRQCLWEIAHTRYHLRAGEQLAWEVPAAEGHDDFVVSLALCARAAERAAPPPFGSIARMGPPEDVASW